MNQRPSRILTPDQRQAHIYYCRAADQIAGAHLPADHYAKLGDSAAFNSNTAHDSRTGFSELLSDTPAWIVDLAHERGWYSRERFAKRCEECEKEFKTAQP